MLLYSYFNMIKVDLISINVFYLQYTDHIDLLSRLYLVYRIFIIIKICILTLSIIICSSLYSS